MRLLICSEQPPVPPLNGLRLVLRSLLPELRRRHDVRVLCFAGPSEAVLCDDLTRVLHRKSRARAVDVTGALARAFLTGRPMRLDEHASAMAPALREELAMFRPDVVQVMSGGLASLAHVLDGRPAVVAALDAAYRNHEAQAAVSRGLRRSLELSEARRVRRYEEREYARFERVVVVSDADRLALQRLSDEIRVTVIPNGVDADYFAPGAADEADASTVVFHGVMNYAPNVDAACFLAREVWPHVLAGEPQARLVLVGREPTRAVRDLARLPRVEVTGEVPDVRPWLRRACVYACPMVIGTGIKNKLLEAMAHELPCVATPLALGGLTAVPGEDLLVAETSEGLAAAVVSLLRDRDRAAALGRAARAYVRSRHSWAQVAGAYAAVYDEVARL